MTSFFKLIRYKNLFMIAFTMLVLHYGFLKLQNIPLALNDLQFIFLILATVCIAAGGYIINDILDRETDQINKPDEVQIGNVFSENSAYYIYATLNFIGVGIGFYLSNSIEKPMFSSIFILISILLYIYSSSFKQSLLIGNLIVSALIAFVIILVGIFDLQPMITPENQPILATFFKILLDYALFAFVLNFIREIVKDLEDTKGDYNMGMNTLPIVLGVERTAKIVSILSLIPSLLLFYYTYKYYFNNNLYFSAFYSLAFLISPLIYFTVKSTSAKKQKDFKHLSSILKLVMLMGIIFIAVVTLNIKYNA